MNKTTPSAPETASGAAKFDTGGVEAQANRVVGELNFIPTDRPFSGRRWLAK